MENPESSEHKIDQLDQDVGYLYGRLVDIRGAQERQRNRLDTIDTKLAEILALLRGNQS